MGVYEQNCREMLSQDLGVMQGQIWWALCRLTVCVV